MYEIMHMQFHNYLDQLLGSKAMIRLLRCLVSHEGKAFTVRKLAKEAGVSPSETSVGVHQLEKYGILQVQPVGNSYFLSLNDKNYVLDKILRPIMRTERGTLEALVELLRKSLEDRSVISAVLFGSVTAGNDKDDSDIDVFIVSDDFDAATTRAAEALGQVSIAFNKRLSPLIMSKKELLARKDLPLMRSILGSYIHVAGKDLRKVVAR